MNCEIFQQRVCSGAYLKIPYHHQKDMQVQHHVPTFIWLYWSASRWHIMKIRSRYRQPGHIRVNNAQVHAIKEVWQNFGPLYAIINTATLQYSVTMQQIVSYSEQNWDRLRAVSELGDAARQAGSGMRGNTGTICWIKDKCVLPPEKTIWSPALLGCCWAGCVLQTLLTQSKADN